MINSWLVKEGLAWVYPQYCKRADICDRLRELEGIGQRGEDRAVEG
ncbi:MAG: hypothetical protein LBM00_11345 [Deltaproteobacteria bacterium]|nr:hypothetical protein [Deltaproteobacteria bacterium]